MSIKVQSLVWDHYPHGSTKLLVMLKLADVASDDGGDIYKSVPTLARFCKISERQMRRVLRELCDEGVLVHVGERRVFFPAGGSQMVNEYRILLDVLVSFPSVDEISKSSQGGDNLAPPEETKGEDILTPPEDAQGGDKSCKGVTSESQGGDIAMSTNSSFNPSFTTLLSASDSDSPDSRSLTAEQMKDLGSEFVPQSAGEWRTWCALMTRLPQTKITICTRMFVEWVEMGVTLGDANIALQAVCERNVTLHTPKYLDGPVREQRERRLNPAVIGSGAAGAPSAHHGLSEKDYESDATPIDEIGFLKDE